MAPPNNNWNPPNRNLQSYQRNGSSNRQAFAIPPLSSRPRLFCCPVAESNSSHLPRSFVNPGRHLMNLQLRSFLECADDADYYMSKCEVSHIVEVTTRVLSNVSSSSSDRNTVREQWNISGTAVQKHPWEITTPPLDEEDGNMMMDRDVEAQDDIPYSTYQSMSTRHFITQNTSNTWQVPPHSRQYRDTHPEPLQSRGSGNERYMEIPPFKTMPYTSDGSSGNNPGATSARAWIPSCSLLMWCTRHNNFYEVHVLS